MADPSTTTSTNPLDYGAGFNPNPVPQKFTPKEYVPEGTIGFGEESDPSAFNLDNSKISLQDTDAPKLSDGEAAAKARQAHIAYGDQSPGEDVLKDKLKDGGEQDIRKTLDSRTALTFDQFKRQQVEKIARSTDLGPLTDDDYEKVRSITLEQYQHDPSTAIERVFADKYMKSARYTLENMPGMFTSVQNPSILKDLNTTVDASTKVASHIIANRTVAENTAEELKAKWEKEGATSTLQTWTQQLIPLWSWGNLVDAVPNAKTDTYLHGDNLKQQVQYLYSLSPIDFKKQFTAAVDRISKSSLLDAQVFADAVISYGNKDKAIDNWLGALDIYFAGDISKSTAQFARSTYNKLARPSTLEDLVASEQKKEAVKRFVGAAVRASAEKLPEDSKAVMGDLASSAEIKAQKQAMEGFAKQDPLGDSEKLFEQLPHFINPTRIGDNPGSLSEGLTNQLVREMAVAQKQGLKALSNPAKVVRAGEEAYKVGFEEAKKALLERFKSFSDAVLDVNFIAAEETRTNTAAAELRLGKTFDKSAERKSLQATRDAEFEKAAPKTEATPVAIKTPSEDFPPWFSSREEFEASKDAKPTAVSPNASIADIYKELGSPEELNRPDVKHIERPVRIRDDGSPVHASYSPKTNTVTVNREGVLSQFKEKPWLSPKVKGVDPLPSHYFKKPEDWLRFVEEHESAHANLKRLSGETKAAYENRINQKALESLKQPWQMDWNPRFVKDNEVRQLFNDLGSSLWTKRGVKGERGGKPVFDQTGFKEQFAKQPAPDEVARPFYNHSRQSSYLSRGLTKDQRLEMGGLSANEQVVRSQAIVNSKAPQTSIIRDEKTIKGLRDTVLTLPPKKRAPLLIKQMRDAYEALPKDMQYSVSKNPTWQRFEEMEQKYLDKGKTFAKATEEKVALPSRSEEAAPKNYTRLSDNDVRSILGNLPGLVSKSEASKKSLDLMMMNEARRAQALRDFIKERIQIETAVAKAKNNGKLPEYFSWKGTAGFRKAEELLGGELGKTTEGPLPNFTKAKEQQQKQKFRITDPDTGEDLGYYKINNPRSSKDLHLDFIRNDSDKPFSRKVFDSVIEKIKDDFPEALSVSGERITGAKGVGGQARLQLRSPSALEDILKYGLPEKEWQRGVEGPQDWQQARQQQQKTKMVAETKIGTPSAALFESEDQARYYAKDVYKLGTDAFKIRQQGTGYYLSIAKAVDETAEGFRNNLIQSDTTSKFGFFDNFIGSLRTADERLSDVANSNRKVAVNAQKAIYKDLRPIAKNIAALDNPGVIRRALGLGRDEFREFEAVLDKNRDFIDPATGKRGQYYNTIGEFEKAFQDTNGKLPSYNQTKAYFSTTLLNDLDYIQRNLNFAMQAQRAGLEKINPKIFLNAEDGTKKPVEVPEFLGRVSDKLPWSEGVYTNPEDAGILVVDHNTGRARYYDRNSLASDIRNEIRAKVKNQGYKVIEIAQPMERPLKGIGHESELVNFAVVRDFDANKPDWFNYPYRPGGHVVYNDPFYVKQPVIRAKDGGKRAGRFTREGYYYEGDVSILNVSNEADARKAAENTDKARQLLKDKKEAELRDHLGKTTPWNLDEFKALFEPKTMEDGSVRPPVLSKDHPITWTREGRNVADMDHYKGILERQYPNFTNSTRSGYNISALLDKKFWGERDPNLPRLERYGTEQNPIFKLAEPRLMRPLEAMNSGVANAMRTRLLGDYKIQAVEHFIQEFADVAQTGYTVERMGQNPLYYLHNFPFDTEANVARVNMAKQVRARTLNFLGTTSPFKETVDMAQRNLINQIYQRLGQTKGDWISDHMLPATADPFTYARSAAFHLNLGLFNPAQVVVQGMAALHAVAIAGPVIGVQGMGKALFMQLLNHTDNPNIIDHFANMASKFGVDHNHFKESFQLLKDTGFDFVGKETAWRNDVQDPKLYENALGKFLSWGTTFFNTGESFGRLTAWNVAYKEFRNTNPDKIINLADRNSILARADTLSGNMTRASHASFEHGVLSIPSQYWAWKLRMMDQMIGSRLTTAEKARMMFTYSVLFGVPVGLNTGLAMWPMYDEAKQAAIKHHINTDDTKMHLIFDGAFSTAIKEMVGKDYNIPTRYGPDAIPIFRDVIMGDKGIFDFLGGASGSSINNLFNSAAPFTRYITHMFDNTWKPTAEDFLEASKGFSAANVGLRSWYAYNTGRYISKNHNLVTDKLGKTDAALMFFGGLLPQEVGETGDLIKYLKNEKLAKAAVKRDFQLYYKRSLESAAAGDEQSSDLYSKRAKALLEGGGFTPHEQAALVHQVWAEKKTLYDKLQQTRIKKDPNWLMEGNVAKHVDDTTPEGFSGEQ